MLTDLTYGPLWMILLLALVLTVGISAARGRGIPGPPGRIADRLTDKNGGRVFRSPLEKGTGTLRNVVLRAWNGVGLGASPLFQRSVGLLLLWVLCAWLGLLIISLIAVPMTVNRYALPAAIPALLLPLVLTDRLHRWAPLIIAAVFTLGNTPDWLTRSWAVEPGFRELAEYVRENVDPEDEAVALVIAPSQTPHWAQMRRLALRYYPLDDRPVYEVQPDADGSVAAGSIFEEPRALYLIVFRMDPFPMILQAGRKPAAILHQGTAYSQLLFSPYRLVKVDPLHQP